MSTEGSRKAKSGSADSGAARRMQWRMLGGGAARSIGRGEEVRRRWKGWREWSVDGEEMSDQRRTVPSKARNKWTDETQNMEWNGKRTSGCAVSSPPSLKQRPRAL
jgi:hypothetical protein